MAENDAKPDRGHGSPYDRGHMDYYYGRRPRPHKRPDGFTDVLDLTDEEKAEYHRGFNECDERKDWR